MTKIMLSIDDLTKLKSLGDILIPASEGMAGFSAVSDIERLLQLATTASGTAPQMVAAIRDLPSVANLAEAKTFAQNAPAAFAVLAQVISGAYYMAREVLIALNYPLERRNPAGVSDFADEYMTGIVDPVVENNRGAA
ncbi:MAG: hypothetical protein V4586_06470 [Pseudomonadota bacterium]